MAEILLEQKRLSKRSFSIQIYWWQITSALIKYTGLFMAAGLII